MANELLNYVGFKRGTPRAFEKTDKNANTLYFISEKDAKVGQLWLGDKLISGSVGSLSDIANIEISGDLVGGSILVYDAESEKWVNKEFNQLSVSNMVGALEDADGVAGLVPAPLAGDQNKFLSGSGEWVSIVGTLTEDQIAAVEQAAVIAADVADLKDILNDKEVTDEETGETSTAPGLVTKVGDLTTIVNNMQTSITNIEERLVWVEIEEE